MSKSFVSLRLFSTVTFVFLLALLVISPQPAQALDITIGCTGNPATDRQSLVDNVILTNNTAGNDTINLTSNCVYTLIDVLEITDTAGALTLNGNGSTISGGNTTNIFSVITGAQLLLSNVELRNGFTDVEGGAIFNEGSLTLNGVRLESNQSRSGGALHNSGTASITNTTFTGNNAACCSGEELFGRGGGIFNAGTISMNNSLIATNRADGRGGGLYNASSTTSTITTSTISGNTSQNDGGGVYNATGSLVITSATIANNISSVSGGGIFHFNTAITNLGNSIVAGNTATTSGTDIQSASGSTINSQNYNLLGTENASAIGGLTSANIIGDPQLVALANNGGPTLTHALPIDSPATDKGNCSGPTDQRGSGFTRPLDFAGIENASGGNGCEIGAFEIQNTEPVARDDNYETQFETQLAVEPPGVLDNDSDTEGEELTAVIVTLPTQGTLNLGENGSFQYNPPDNFSGDVTFTYKATDGVQESDPATVTITVLENPAPVANNDMYETGFEVTLDVPAAQGVLANDTDANNDPLSGQLVTSTTNGTLTFRDDGSFTYIPNDDFIGRDQFTYRASDGISQSNPATVTLMVLAPGPNNLVVEGELNEGEIRPFFLWDAPINDEGTPLPIQWYNVVIENDAGEEVINNWFQITGQFCTAQACRWQPSRDILFAGFLNGNYDWRVRGWYNDTFTAFSQTAQFIVDVPPPPLPQGFTVTATSGRPVIEFLDAPGITWIHVYVGTSDYSETVNFAWYEKAAAADCVNGRCILIPDAITVNGNYVVHLQTWGPAGFNLGDSMAWSNPVNFSLDFPPAELIEPLTPVISNGQVTLRWNASNFAAWYQLFVGTPSPEFDTRFNQWLPATELGCNGGGVCEFTVPQDAELISSLSYVWYVQAWGPGGIRTSEGVSGWQLGGQFTP